MAATLQDRPAPGWSRAGVRSRRDRGGWREPRRRARPALGRRRWRSWCARSLSSGRARHARPLRAAWRARAAASDRACGGGTAPARRRLGRRRRSRRSAGGMPPAGTAWRRQAVGGRGRRGARAQRRTRRAPRSVVEAREDCEADGDRLVRSAADLVDERQHAGASASAGDRVDQHAAGDLAVRARRCAAQGQSPQPITTPPHLDVAGVDPQGVGREGKRRSRRARSANRSRAGVGDWPTCLGARRPRRSTLSPDSTNEPMWRNLA